MGIKKFIKNVKSSLGLEDFKKEGKKKSIKALLKKLNKRKKDITKKLKSSLNKKEEKELQEELNILSLQIKKGKEILYKLYEKKK